MKWSKQKRLSKYTQSPDLDTKKPSHVFSGRPTSLHSLPLPRGSQIDMSTLEPRNAKIFLDQNGCFYITTKSPIDLSFHFYTGQKYTTLEPIPED